MSPPSQAPTPPAVHETPTPTVDALVLARAVRFLLCLVVSGLSIFSVVSCLFIDRFRNIFHDLLEDKPLPFITVFIIHAQPALTALCVLMVPAAVATLFSRRVVATLYILGGLAITAILVTGAVHIGLFMPLVRITVELGGH